MAPSAVNSAMGTSLTSLWAWDGASGTYYFYAPSLQALGGSTLHDYIKSRGYLDFTDTDLTLGNGAGFWVNKK
jgi:hypothetical protein